MYLHEILLILLTGVLILGAPIYMFFRRKMVEKPAVEGFRRKRVLKVTSINIFINMIVYLIFLLMLISILYKQGTFDIEIIFLTIIFLGITGLPFYGNGIYITSVVLEAFTLPDLRRLKSFKTQFIATHLFHGPIGHVLIYSGYILALFLLSIMDIVTGDGASLSPVVIGVCGLAVGIIYSIAQAFNGTIPYQFVTSLAAFLIFVIVHSARVHGLLFDYSLSTFFFFFSIAFLITSLVYLVWKAKKTENIWDMSGY